MIELTEEVWKHRFTQGLMVFFVSRGASVENALADARAHAEDEYAVRGDRTPEQHAVLEIAAIEAEFDGG
jgi:hypothetical protein